MQKRAGVFRRFVGKVLIGGTIGAAIANPQNLRAQEIAQRPQPPKGLRTMAQLGEPRQAPPVYRTNAANLTAEAQRLRAKEEAQRAKALAEIRATLGTNAAKAGTNTLIKLHDACKRAFDAQGLAFGTNEMGRSIDTLKIYLKNNKFSRVKNAWLRGSGLEDAMAQAIVPGDLNNQPVRERLARIRSVLSNTSKLPRTDKEAILGSLLK